MPLSVLTATVAVVTFLDVVNAGMVSSFLPLPLVWTLLLGLLVWRERAGGWSRMVRCGLTIAASFFTIALVSMYLVHAGSFGYLVLIITGAAAALLVWSLTDPSYAHASLPQDRPR